MEVVEYKPPKKAAANNQPLAFLAGPIKGAPNWQRSVIETVGSLREGNDQIHVANPRRDFLNEKDFSYRQQARWEREYLFRAAKRGVNVFWLARQDPGLPYPDGRSYAQTTRFEFGMIYAQSLHSLDVNMVLGIEPGYSGSVDYYLDVADELGLSVHKDLRSLCVDAVANIMKLKAPNYG